MQYMRSAMTTAFSVILYSADFDRIHYGLMAATAAACLDRPVMVFITMGACRAFTLNKEGQCTGWQMLGLSSGAAPNIHSPIALNNYFRENHIATFEELLEAAQALSIRFMVCETGLRAEKLRLEELGGDLHFLPGGMVTFLKQAMGGEIVTL